MEQGQPQTTLPCEGAWPRPHVEMQSISISLRTSISDGLGPGISPEVHGALRRPNFADHPHQQEDPSPETRISRGVHHFPSSQGVDRPTVMQATSKASAQPPWTPETTMRKDGGDFASSLMQPPAIKSTQSHGKTTEKTIPSKRTKTSGQ